MSTRTDPRDWLRTARETSNRRIALYALLTGLIGFFLLPIETGLVTALKTNDAFVATLPYVPPGPEGFTLRPARTALAELLPKMLNSVVLVIPATILSALGGSLAAYGMTNLDWKNQLAVVVLFVAGIFIPYQAVLVPLSRFWAIVGIGQYSPYAELVELIVTHTAYGLPITTILFRSYYQNFSDEMLEAARLDGASAFSIYRNIILPLSLPMFAVTMIYQFTQIWNDLLFALVLINQPAAQVVTQGLANLGGGIQTQFNAQMAGALIAAFPTLLVYIAFGEKFAKGVASET